MTNSKIMMENQQQVVLQNQDDSNSNYATARDGTTSTVTANPTNRSIYSRINSSNKWNIELVQQQQM